MKIHDKRANRIPHTDKSITTMLKRKHVDCNDILARDDVNGLLAEVSANKVNATDMIILWYDDEDTVHMRTTGPINSKAVYMLEFGKNFILNSDEDDK